MKKTCCLILTILTLSCFRSPLAKEVFGYETEIAKNVVKIDTFPDLPENYRYYDYSAQAIALDDVVFRFAGNPIAVAPDYYADDVDTWDPIGFWIDQTRAPDEYDPLQSGYLERSFGLPTYIGDVRVVNSGSEAVTTISMILGSSYAGIDKSAQAFDDAIIDFVSMTFASYDTGSQLVHNVGAQGQSFWYDLFPQIMFTRLYALYTDTPYMRQMVLNGADQWLEALPYFVDEEGNPDYEFVGYNVVLESPTLVGDHIEPPNGGLSFLFYAAYEMTGEEKT